MTSEGFEHGIERRVQARERRFDGIEQKLDVLIEAFHSFRHDVDACFTSVEARLVEAVLEAKASSADVAELRGMVKTLPTKVQMITLVFGIPAGAFAIARFGLPRP